jgi:hypothetical protein
VLLYTHQSDRREDEFILLLPPRTKIELIESMGSV